MALSAPFLNHLLAMYPPIPEHDSESQVNNLIIDLIIKFSPVFGEALGEL